MVMLVLQEETFGSLSAFKKLGKPTKDGVLGTASAPIHTTSNVRTHFKEKMWSTIHTFAFWILLICGAGVLTKDRWIRKVQPRMKLSTKFTDVKGINEAKAELQEIVHYLRDTEVQGRLCLQGLLLGKQEFLSSLVVVVNLKRCLLELEPKESRDLFSAAKKCASCIIFIDEIDAIGGSRNSKDQQYMKMTLNQLLVELDGFEQNEGIIVDAATNLPESLDKALVRPGRFDRHITVRKPDVEGRRQILESHMSKVLKADDVDLMIIARGTPGLSGADLANLVNVAALKAAMDGSKDVTMSDLEFAKDRILMGGERKSAVISDELRNLTAFHEVVMPLLPFTQKVLVQSTKQLLCLVVWLLAWFLNCRIKIRLALLENRCMLGLIFLWEAGQLKS